MLEMVEFGDRWSLGSTNPELTKVSFDWGVTLTIGSAGPQMDIRIEHPAMLTGFDGNLVRLVPEGDPTELAPLLQIVRRRLIRLDAFKDGRLEMDVLGGIGLTVPVSQDFEPWEILGPSGLRIVSMPGGGITVWSGERLRK